MENEYHRMIVSGGPRTFVFPRPCDSDLDTSRVCGDPDGFSYRDSAREALLSVSPIGGYEYRYLNESAHAFDLGMIAQGFSGPVSFYLDARTYTEMHEDRLHAGYDREFVERQDETSSGAFAYSSYSRYRSNLSYDWTWGRLTAAREGAHWGPGLFTNLVFQQEVIPFNQLTFTTHLGPVTVQSLYGRLAVDRNWENDTSTSLKSIFAHRYEWQPIPNLLLGVSEQLILYKADAPFAFLPIVPLFIAKASEKERLNNGNLAGDISYRFPGIASVYTEFLIDDMQSPGSIFNDYWANKWAWMAGCHFVRPIRSLLTGVILEVSRVEPWVYTHYDVHTSQAAHEDYPIGNPFGPNSLAVVGKGYARAPGRFDFGLRVDAVWKGTGKGSGLEDTHVPEDPGTKAFLGDVPSTRFTVTPSAAWTWRRLDLWGRLSLGDEAGGVTGLQYHY